MLICITNRCHFECSHCMKNSNKNGQHMSIKTFQAALDFGLKFKANNIMLTGGEPSLHPQYIEMVNLARNTMKGVISIASNGWYIKDGKVPEQYKVQNKNKGILLQISYDEKYYPPWSGASTAIENSNDYVFIHNKTKKLSKCTKLMNRKDIDFNKKSISCPMLRENIKNGYINNFSQYIMLIESMLKICVPVVDVNGNIRIGETDICATIGNVYSSNDELIENARNTTCNNCGNYYTSIISALIKKMVR